MRLAELSPWTRRWLWARSFVYQVMLFVTVLIFAVPIMFSLVVPEGKRRWRYAYGIAHAWCGVAMWMLRVICGVTYEVHGRAWLPREPSVVLMKHQSAWETISQLRIFPPQCWVLKKELMGIPFFGWSLQALRPIPIDRKRKKESLQAVVDIGRERLQQGLWVVVFPEGTRVAPGENRRYRRGGAALAAASGALVVPVAHNAGTHWRSGSLLKIPGTITLSIGPPIDPAEHGNDTDAVLEATRAWIEREQLLLDAAVLADADRPR
jgi:1-acyl-sn-glycerol-3-phosphate acyltransferase